MCRWTVGSGLLSFFLVFPFFGAQAQGSLPRFVVDQIEAAAAEGASAEDLILHYEGLLAQPLNLNAATRRELAESFGGEERVPVFGLTMGIKTLVEARETLIVSLGASHAKAVFDSLYGRDDSTVPAAFLQLYPNVTLYLDEESAAKL